MNHKIKILLISMLFISVACVKAHSKSDRFVFEHKSMGTLFRIICISENQALAKKTANACFRRIDELNLIMSDYLPDSELNKLSRQSGSGNYFDVSNDLYKIILLSRTWSNKTNGIFDITIGPLSQLWRRAGRKERLPTHNEIKHASKSVGFRYIKIDPNQKAVKLKKPGMQLDLGGIAKGFAVDEVFRMFIEAGIDQVLVDGGGDIRVGDPPPDKPGWHIILENREKNHQNIYLSNSSIATSGDLYRYIKIDSVKYGHIIDPRTGLGITSPRIVTVQAETCTEADVLASVLSILGPEEGFDFLTSISNTQAVIIQQENGKNVRFEKGKLDYIK